MDTLTPFEVLTDFSQKVLVVLKNFCYELYNWLLSGIEFDIPNIDGGSTHYSLTGLDLIGAIAISWFTARIIASIVDAVIPN